MGRKLLQNDKDKNLLYKEVQRDPEYERLDVGTGRLISVLLGDRRLQDCIEKNRAAGVDKSFALGKGVE